jgi:hypothetical protein
MGNNFGLGVDTDGTKGGGTKERQQATNESKTDPTHREQCSTLHFRGAAGKGVCTVTFPNQPADCAPLLTAVLKHCEQTHCGLSWVTSESDSNHSGPNLRS